MRDYIDIIFPSKKDYVPSIARDGELNYHYVLKGWSNVIILCVEWPAKKMEKNNQRESNLEVDENKHFLELKYIHT